METEAVSRPAPLRTTRSLPTRSLNPLRRRIASSFRAVAQLASSRSQPILAERPLAARKQGPWLHRAARGCSCTPPNESGCFGPTITTTGGSTTPPVSQLAKSREAPAVLCRRRLPSDERKPGKRRMRPAVAGKQVRTLMPLQPSTVVDDDSCEIGEVRGIARSWRESCFRCTAGTAQVRESTLLSPGVQPLCSWRERRRLIRATTTSGETTGA